VSTFSKSARSAGLSVNRTECPTASTKIIDVENAHLLSSNTPVNPEPGLLQRVSLAFAIAHEYATNVPSAQNISSRYCITAPTVRSQPSLPSTLSYLLPVTPLHPSALSSGQQGCYQYSSQCLFTAQAVYTIPTSFGTSKFHLQTINCPTTSDSSPTRRPCHRSSDRRSLLRHRAQAAPRITTDGPPFHNLFLFSPLAGQLPRPRTHSTCHSPVSTIQRPNLIRTNTIASLIHRTDLVCIGAQVRYCGFSHCASSFVI